jgi:hypothetical protein
MLRQVINNRLCDGDIIIDEGEIGVMPAATKNTNASEAKTTWSNCFSSAICFNLDFFSLKSYKFRIDSIWSSWQWGFCKMIQKSKFFKMLGLTEWPWLDRCNIAKR